MSTKQINIVQVHIRADRVEGKVENAVLAIEGVSRHEAIVLLGKARRSLKEKELEDITKKERKDGKDGN